MLKWSLIMFSHMRTWLYHSTMYSSSTNGRGHGRHRSMISLMLQRPTLGLVTHRPGIVCTRPYDTLQYYRNSPELHLAAWQHAHVCYVPTARTCTLHVHLSQQAGCHGSLMHRFPLSHGQPVCSQTRMRISVRRESPSRGERCTFRGEGVAGPFAAVCGSFVIAITMYALMRSSSVSTSVILIGVSTCSTSSSSARAMHASARPMFAIGGFPLSLRPLRAPASFRSRMLAPRAVCQRDLRGAGNCAEFGSGVETLAPDGTRAARGGAAMVPRRLLLSDARAFNRSERELRDESVLCDDGPVHTALSETSCSAFIRTEYAPFSRRDRGRSPMTPSVSPTSKLSSRWERRCRLGSSVGCASDRASLHAPCRLRVDPNVPFPNFDGSDGFIEAFRV